MNIINTELSSFDQLELPKTLYKYRDWAGDYDKRIIANREVFYAAPTSFEDVHDCKNPLRYDLLSHQEILNKYFRDSQIENPGYTIEEHIRFAIYWTNNSLVKNKDFMEQKQREAFMAFDRRIGVLCLTEYPSEISMWEKYAKYHTTQILDNCINV